MTMGKQVEHREDVAERHGYGKVIRFHLRETSNAGILTRGTIDTYTLEDFDRMVAINVRAAFVGIQAAAQEMNDGGRIVIIGSNTAIRTAFPGASVYSMTKAALVGLVRGAAIDLAPRYHGQQCSTGTDSHRYEFSGRRVG
jgi:NADP-dependent 3-hydroxy acid dehydrogenase YdfG